MRKIMFNDKYELTKAVLEGWKTMTRRIVSQDFLDKVKKYQEEYFANTLDYISMEDAIINMIGPEGLFCNSFKIGEIVAIAQSYESILCDLSISDIIRNEISDNHSGYKNKMFVKAELMPHHIKITNIRVEHLQDISDGDCLREGVRLWEDADPEYKLNPLGKLYEIAGRWDGYKSPREAFAALIDKVSGKGTWQSNPLVWVYKFELVD